MKVENLSGADILCSVVTGGVLSDNKSINVPGVNVSLPGLTSRDRSDLKFAVEHDFDYIAVSFVRSAADIHAVRELLQGLGSSDIRLIAKIENRGRHSPFPGDPRRRRWYHGGPGATGVEVPMEEILSCRRK